MPKEIRFSKLVQKGGKPEPMTLWTKPKDNPAFMNAINENRVVTVFQKPTGTKKDFGLVGFHQEQFATYLVFPKPLPKLGEVHVIGIKYDLLQEQPESQTARKKVESPKAVLKDAVPDGSNAVRNGVHKSKPDQESGKTFEVKIVRTGRVETILTVDAMTISEAEANALKTVKSQGFQPEDIHDDVKSITQI
jgi:hypothetical protein